VSTYDERSNKAGKSGNEGLFQPARGSGATYHASGRDPDFDELDDDALASGGATAKLPDPAVPFGTDAGYGSESAYTPDPGFGAAAYSPEADEFEERRKVSWHGGADLGLLVLRLVVGGTFIAHGLQHLFGLFHGIGEHGFAHFLATAGYKYTDIMAWVAGGTELAGGGLLVLGLFTPLAAAGLLALMANVIVLKWPLGFFTPGYELELVLAAGSFALLFSGPGRASLDRPTPWFRRPGVNGFIFLVIGAAAAVVSELVLRNR
jgi:putative oxidoreductase